MTRVWQQNMSRRMSKDVFWSKKFNRWENSCLAKDWEMQAKTLDNNDSLVPLQLLFLKNSSNKTRKFLCVDETDMFLRCNFWADSLHQLWIASFKSLNVKLSVVSKVIWGSSNNDMVSLGKEISHQFCKSTVFSILLPAHPQVLLMLIFGKNKF